MHIAADLGDLTLPPLSPTRVWDAGADHHLASLNPRHSPAFGTPATTPQSHVEPMRHNRHAASCASASPLLDTTTMPAPTAAAQPVSVGTISGRVFTRRDLDELKTLETYLWQYRTQSMRDEYEAQMRRRLLLDVDVEAAAASASSSHSGSQASSPSTSAKSRAKGKSKRSPDARPQQQPQPDQAASATDADVSTATAQLMHDRLLNFPTYASCIYRIVKRRLYRLRHPSLEVYFKTQLGISRAQVYRVINAGRTMVHLAGQHIRIGDTQAAERLPRTQTVCRQLTHLANGHAVRERMLWLQALARVCRQQGLEPTTAIDVTAGVTVAQVTQAWYELRSTQKWIGAPDAPDSEDESSVGAVEDMDSGEDAETVEAAATLLGRDTRASTLSSTTADLLHIPATPTRYPMSAPVATPAVTPIPPPLQSSPILQTQTPAWSVPRTRDRDRPTYAWDTPPIPVTVNRSPLHMPPPPPAAVVPQHHAYACQFLAPPFSILPQLHQQQQYCSDKDSAEYLPHNAS
ncbi:hypothetical protein RI367_007509 [Sorochytrium milnesiophthora]